MLFLIIKVSILICLFNGTFSQITGDDIALFKKWAVKCKQKNKKCVENPSIFIQKLQNFVKQLRLIEEQEKKFKSKQSLFKMGLNQRSGDSPAEKAKWRGLKDCGGSIEQVKPRDMQPEFGPAPDSIDYRDFGYISDVMDQGDCGSCYAFAANGALEAHLAKKYGFFHSLSVQNIVDCSRNLKVPRENLGCDGGYAETTYEYIRRNGGIDSSLFYPYEAVEGPCRYDSEHSVGNLTGYQRLYADEETLKRAVAAVGPVVVGINADFDTFYGYAEGIYDDLQCRGKINHAVYIVGYGTDYSSGNAVDYWIIKNSWSPYWGENGFMRMLRGVNLCSITAYMVYPIV